MDVLRPRQAVRRPHGGALKAWIDIDNPPQVQYLAPFIKAFEQRGHEVVVTARDYGITTQLLAAGGIRHRLVGREFSPSRLGKVGGTAARALQLAASFARTTNPSMLLSTSRSGVMAAWLLGVPSFMVLDYEHAEVRSFRAFGTTVMHPGVIDGAVFAAKGFASERLVPFNGLKEDISFAGRDLGAVAAHDFGVPRDGEALVLVRPPSETTHYRRTESLDLTRDVMARLAADPAVRVVFSPRHAHQVVELRSHSWRNEPIVVERPIEFVALLKGVDSVVAAGGTMLREAAYLGLPAISLFRSETGAVDRWLEDLGAVTMVSRAAELDRVQWRRGTREPRFAHHPEVVEELTERMVGVR